MRTAGVSTGNPRERSPVDVSGMCPTSGGWIVTRQNQAEAMSQALLELVMSLWDARVTVRLSDLEHLPAPEFNEIAMIRVGGCTFFINCDDFKLATQPVPKQYVAADHVSVGAAVSLMGNHLIDVRTPELAKPRDLKEITFASEFQRSEAERILEQLQEG